MLHTCVNSIGVSLGSIKSISHNLFTGLRCPVETGTPEAVMTAVSAVNVAVHPASHNWPKETRECCNLGTKCACNAEDGNMGTSMGSDAVSVAVSTDPSGNEMDIGSFDACVATTGTVVVR